MTDEEIISTLTTISTNISKIFPVILLVAGTIGHICNLAIFSKKSQRTNPVSIYFLANTIANVVALYFGVLVRYLQDNYDIDPINNSLVPCRARSFLFYLSLSLSNWYILLATVDRYLISSDNHRRRQLSSVKNAYRIIGLVTIAFVLLYCHILILYNIQTVVSSTGVARNYCYPQRGSYRIFSDIQLLVQFSLLPPLLMSVVIILIIKNIRASHRRVANTIVPHHQARIRKRDLQLSRMLLLQVIVIIVCSLPLAISQLITTMTLTWSKTPLRVAIESFIALVARQLAFMNCSISFYIYTLAGSQFRLEIRHVVNQLSMFLCRRRLLQGSRIGLDQSQLAGKVQGASLRPKPIATVGLKADERTTTDPGDQV